MDKLFLKNEKFEFTFYMQSNEMNIFINVQMIAWSGWLHVQS